MVPFPGKEGTRPVGTGAERRRVGCWGNAPHSECGGAGHDRTWRSSRPCYARRLNFHVRLVCAHSPNSPVGVASAPFWGGVGWGGTSARPKRLKTASASAYFALASACSRLAHAWQRLPALLHPWLYASFASSSAACAFALACIAASFHAAWRRQAPHSPLTLHARVCFLGFPLTRVSRWRRGPNRVCPQWTDTLIISVLVRLHCFLCF